jgi:hypothetical protein
VLELVADLRQVADRLEALVSGGPGAPAEAPPAANEDRLSLLEWYRRRAAQLPGSSEDEDRRALAAAGFVVSRECVRQLRRELAPEAWRRPGRQRRRA